MPIRPSGFGAERPQEPKPIVDLKQQINKILDSVSKKIDQEIENIKDSRRSLRNNPALQQELTHHGEKDTAALFKHAKEEIRSLLEQHLPRSKVESRMVEVEQQIDDLKQSYLDKLHEVVPRERAAPEKKREPSPEALFRSGAKPKAAPPPAPRGPAPEAKVPSEIDKIWDKFREMLKEKMLVDELSQAWTKPQTFSEAMEMLLKRWDKTQTPEQKDQLFQQITQAWQGGAPAEEEAAPKKGEEAPSRPSLRGAEPEAPAKPKKSLRTAGPQAAAPTTEVGRGMLGAGALTPFLQALLDNFNKWIPSSADLVRADFAQLINSLIGKSPDQQMKALHDWEQKVLNPDSGELHIQYVMLTDNQKYALWIVCFSNNSAVKGFTDVLNNAVNWGNSSAETSKFANLIIDSLIEQAIAAKMGGSGPERIGVLFKMSTYDGLWNNPIDNLSYNQILALWKMIPGLKFDPIDLPLWQAYGWFYSTDVTPEDKALAEALFNQIVAYKEGGKSFADLTAWAKDFMNEGTYAHASPTAKLQFVTISNINLPLTSIYNQIKAWKEDPNIGPAAYRVAEKLLAWLSDHLLEADGTVANFKAWFGSETSVKDIYWLAFGGDPFTPFDAAEAASIKSQLQTICGIDVGNVTPMDQIYFSALENRENAQSDQDWALWDYLVKDLEARGSKADPASLSNWALEVVKGNLYKNATFEADMAFLRLCKVNAPLIDKYEAIQNWLSTSGIGAASKHIGELFLEETKNLIKQGKFALSDLQSWYNTTFATKDVYWQSLCKNTDEALAMQTQLTNILGISVSGPTEMDKLYFSAWNYLQQVLGTPDQPIWDKLMTLFQSLGSSDSKIMTLHKEAVSLIRENPSFWATSALTKNTFFSLTGTAIETIRHNLENWATNDAERALVAQIFGEIDRLENTSSNPTADDVRKFIENHLFANAIYFSFPGLTRERLDALLPIVKAGIKSPEPNEIEQILLTCYAYNATSPDGQKLFANLIDTIKNNPYGPRCTLTQLQDLVRKNIFPGFWGKYPNLDPTGADALKFVAITHLDLPTFDPFTDILEEMKNYFAPLQGLSELIQKFAPRLGLPSLDRWTEAQWKAFAGSLKGLETSFRSDLAKLSPAQLDARYGAGTSANAQHYLALFAAAPEAMSGRNLVQFRAALDIFAKVVQEITTLENEGGSWADLKAWAATINTSQLNSADLAKFNRLKG